jgi:hypothetical protein
MDKCIFPVQVSGYDEAAATRTQTTYFSAHFTNWLPDLGPSGGTDVT